METLELIGATRYPIRYPTLKPSRPDFQGFKLTKSDKPSPSPKTAFDSFVISQSNSSQNIQYYDRNSIIRERYEQSHRIYHYI